VTILLILRVFGSPIIKLFKEIIFMTESNKYILHYGSLAGMPYKIAEACNTQGRPSKNVILCDRDVDDLSRQLAYHEEVFCNNDSALEKSRKLFNFMLRASNEASLIHYYSANIFFRELHFLLEGPLMRANKIPMLVTFGGTDIRVPSIAIKNNPYFKYFAFDGSWTWEKRVKFRVWSMSQFIDAALVDPEMLDYMSPQFKKIYPFRQPVDMEYFPNEQKVQNEIPVLMHIPTSPEFKGTEEIKKAVDQLKSEGYQFEFRLKRQLSQTQVYEELVKADIYIDELRCGSHGVTSVEAMAAGCAVITFILDRIKDQYPADLPIVSANTDTIYEKLKYLLDNPSLYKELGKQGRAYAKKYHCSMVVAKHQLEIYDDFIDYKNKS